MGMAVGRSYTKSSVIKLIPAATGSQLHLSTKESSMATEPTPEQSAHEILSIFINHFRVALGGALPSNSLVLVWSSRKLQFENLELGIEFAKAQGWIKPNSDGTSYALTQAGLDAF